MAAPEDDEKPKKLPMPERVDRLKKVCDKLSPRVKVHGILEPSNTLIDRRIAAQKVGDLRHVPWDKYTRRDRN